MNDCNKRNKCGCGLDLAIIPASLGDDTGSQKPYNGAYQDTLVKYEANGHLWFYTRDGVPTFLPSSGGGGGTDNFDDITGRPKYAGEEMTSETNIPSVEDLREYVGDQAEELRGLLSTEASTRQEADNNLQSQIDAISASSDVTDIVGTYAELQQYDTSTLGNNDIIKVLQDESQNNETTYYRWNATSQQFTLIGEEGPYYTKSQMDVLLDEKQDAFTTGTGLTFINSALVVDTTTIATKSDLAGKQNTLVPGQNINISGNTISATDTTYSDFVGTDGTDDGAAGLVPAPETTDAGKFLKADGTWGSAGGIPTSSTFWGAAYDSTTGSVQGAITFYNGSQVLETSSTNLTIKGNGNDSTVTIGYYNPSVIGRNQIEVNKKLSSVVDPTNAQDAATKNYVDNILVVNTITNEDWSSLWQ